jgi:hypothetical protein
MTTILIGIITLLLSINFILDTSKPCMVDWTDDLRNHQERIDKCKLISRNNHMEWIIKE